MGFFKKARKMASVSKKFAECKAQHPDVWELGTDLANAAYDARSDYMIDEARTEEGRSKYIRIAGEQMLMAIDDERFEEITGTSFPEPITHERVVCFGIALQKQLTDRFDDDLSSL
jgi:hypothetical protein